MGSKNHPMFQEFTEDEQTSLLKLNACGCGSRIPDDHADKFLGMGLVEVNCGGVSITRAGRGVVAHRPA